MSGPEFKSEAQGGTAYTVPPPGYDDNKALSYGGGGAAGAAQQQGQPQTVAYAVEYVDEEAPPTGHWRDGLCSCLSQWMPTCCAAYLCSFCLTARFYDQFVKRGTYKLVLGAFLVFFILQSVFDRVARANGPTVVEVDDDKTDETHYVVQPPKNPSLYKTAWSIAAMGAFVVLVMGVLLVMRIRERMRTRFAIPGSGCEDCLLSFFCNCCVLAQMYRHVKKTKGMCDGCNLSELGAVSDQEVMTA